MEDEDEDDDKILINPTTTLTHNMYITINIKTTTGILTAINVNDIHMIWEEILTEF